MNNYIMHNSNKFFSSHHFLDLGFEFLLHGTMLFIVLTIFYLSYVVNIEKNQIIKISNDFSYRIENLIRSELIKNNLNVDEYIKNNHDKIEKLKIFYMNQYTEAQINNKMITRDMIFTSAILILITLSYYLLFKNSIDPVPTIIQTIIIFIFVGIIEFIFFLKIVSNYTPISEKEIIDDIKKRLLSNSIFQ